ncbi:MAG: hypothetical protein ACYDH9_11450 [Limisphaerales bacterium]
MKTLNRREFLKQSVGTATTLAVLRSAKGARANDRIIVGVMGVGGRGTALAGMFAARKDVEIAYLCDADLRRFPSARKVVEEAQGRPVKFVQDFRRVLDDRAVDVLINAKLVFNAKTESFPEASEANQFLKRASYRRQWVVPETV